MTRDQILRAIEMVKTAKVETSLMDRGDRPQWFYRLDGAPVELSGWSMVSYPTEMDAKGAAVRTRAAYIDAMEYSLSYYDEVKA